METIHVKVSKPYDVLIGHGLLDRFSSVIRPVLHSNRVAIITDDNVAKLYLKPLEDNLKKSGIIVYSYIFKNGEESKNIRILESILEFLAKNTIHREDTIIALGGGVVGDITGLAGALYMRGVSVIQVPTTLLAAVDSSVGGKTAIDLDEGKNLVGAFWQPVMVVCDIRVLERLPDHVFKEGMAEAIKCNIIKEMPIISWINERTIKNHIRDIVSECIKLKRDIVEQDEYDCNGKRNVLNVGHTVAHAIEKLSSYSISHGYAVGTGVVVEAKIAEEMGVCQPTIARSIEECVKEIDLLKEIPWTCESLAEAMMKDKKNKGDFIMLILPERIGKCHDVSIKYADLLKMLHSISL